MHNIIEITELIDAAKQFPEIYDLSNYNSKHFVHKEKAWVQIGDILQCDVHECKRRWRTIRERFTRELRKTIVNSDYVPQWEYFNQMKFLSHHIKFRNAEATQILQSSNTSILPIMKSENLSDENTKEEEWIESQSDTTMDDEEPQYVVESEEEIDVDMKIEKKISHSVKSNEVQDKMPLEKDPLRLQGLSNKRAALSTPRIERPVYLNNEDEAFCASIAISLSKLSRLNNVRAKLEIFKVLEKYFVLQESENNLNMRNDS